MSAGVGGADACYRREVFSPCRRVLHAGLLIGATLGACGRIGFDAGAEADAGSLVDGAALPAFGSIFGPLQAQPGTSRGLSEFGPSLSSDTLTLVFAAFADAGVGEAWVASDLLVATRTSTSAAFVGRVRQAPPSGDASESEPGLGRARATLYYADAIGLYVSTGDAGGWSPGVALPGFDGFSGPDVAVGDTRLVASRSDAGMRSIYEATRANPDAPWGDPVRLDLGFGDDGYPSLREDGLELFWERDEAGTAAIYRAQRASLNAPFGAAERVEIGGAGAAGVGDPDISDDGRTLVFWSLLSGGLDLYLATRDPL